MDKNTLTKEARKQEYRKRQRTNNIIFAVFTIVVLSVAGLLIFNSFYKAPLKTANNVIDISADMGGFNLKEIRVKVGEPITIRLRSLDKPYHTDGGGKHQWAVDDFNVSIIAPSEGTATATFTPTKAGTYTYYCDICCGGRANPSMVGKLIVEG